MSALKQVGSSGQITLGKKYAGRTVQLIEDHEKGMITLVFGKFIPSKEGWLHEEPIKSKLDCAISYAKKHPPQESSLKDLK
jgi:hypothetical protein